jgi:secreted trypsin-like serine protease
MTMQQRTRQTLAVLAGAAVLALLTAATPAPPPTTSTIVGGRLASQPYPFAAALSQTGRSGSFCTGSLVAPAWVVTAAHCLASFRRASDVTVRVASQDRNGGGFASVADQLLIPNGFDPGGQTKQDYALVRLRSEAGQQTVPIASEAPGLGASVRLLGWGQTTPTKGADYGSDQLKELDVSVVDGSRCGAMDGATEFCVLGPAGQSPCFGDSGGPALIGTGGGWVLAGDTSRGPNPCANGRGTVYTSLAAYRGDIERATGSS